jgi:hypothetical protein
MERKVEKEKPAQTDGVFDRKAEVMVTFSKT